MNVVQSEVPPGRAPPGTQAITSKERDLQLQLHSILSRSSSYRTAPFSHVGAATISPSRDNRWHSIRSITSLRAKALPTAQQPRCHYCGNSRTGTHRTAQFPVPTACDPAVPRTPSIDRLITPATNFPNLSSTISACQPPFPPSHCRMWHTRRHSSSGGLPILVAVQPQGATTRSVEYRRLLHAISTARDKLPGSPATSPFSAQPVET